MPVFRIQLEHTALLVVDLQQRLVPAMHEPDALVDRAARLIRGCAALGVPMIATEHNPEKLGPTLDAIRSALAPAADTPIEPKLKFSGFVESVRGHLSRLARPTVVLCGIEAHVCLMQTALDLLAAGYVPVVCADAISSRRPLDRDMGLARMTGAGVVPATVESVLFEMAHEAGTDRFRAILPIVK